MLVSRLSANFFRRCVATLPRTSDHLAEELSDATAGDKRPPAEVVEIVRQARSESEIRRTLGLDRTTAVKLFLENNRNPFLSADDILSRVDTSRKLKDLLNPNAKVRRGATGLGQAYYWPPETDFDRLLDVDRLVAYQLINSCGSRPQIVWASANVKTEQITNWGFVDVPFETADNSETPPMARKEPNFSLTVISSAIGKAIGQLPQSDVYLKRKSSVTTKKLKLDTLSAKRQLSNAQKDAVLFCAVSSRQSATVIEVDTDVLAAKLESRGDGLMTISGYVAEELGRTVDHSVLRKSFMEMDNFNQFFIGTCCLMCLQFSQELMNAQVISVDK